MVQHIVIFGAGIAGLTSAIALAKHLPEPKPRITVVEIRSQFSTIGGAVNLTPKALRYLDHLGVLTGLVASGASAECRRIEIFDLDTGRKSGEVDFCGPEGDGIGEVGKRYFARRVMRARLQKALLETCERVEGVAVRFGMKVVDINESPGLSRVWLAFEGGECISADLVLGCDGIHSAVRGMLVDPERKPIYTGVVPSMAVSRVHGGDRFRWATTGLVSSRRGSFMASFFDEARQYQYIAVVMETPEVADRTGWKVKGSDQKAVREDILKRFDSAIVPELVRLITNSSEWSLYPIYQLPASGKWISPKAKCILLGDAAHAMPPQGESTGICIEDAIAFSRFLMHHRNQPVGAILAMYEKYRRPKIDVEVEKSIRRWESVKDKGWLAHKLFMLITPWYLWWTAKRRDEEFAEDLSSLEVDIGSQTL